MQAANRIKASAALSPANFAFACLLFAWLWSDYRAYWLDDAYITFRYSQHFAQGMGAVYNIGERVEGYTSFLWMLLSAAPLAVFEHRDSACDAQGKQLCSVALDSLQGLDFPWPDGTSSSSLGSHFGDPARVHLEQRRRYGDAAVCRVDG